MAIVIICLSLELNDSYIRIHSFKYYKRMEKSNNNKDNTIIIIVRLKKK